MHIFTKHTSLFSILRKLIEAGRERSVQQGDVAQGSLVASLGITGG